MDEISSLKARISDLESFLVNAKRAHFVCADIEYSCATTIDSTHPMECDCGAAEFNRKIDKMMSSRSTP